MKIVNILGGLGNQMFQYALAVALREKHPEEDVRIDSSGFKGYPLHNGYELKRVFDVDIPEAGFKEQLQIFYPLRNYRMWQLGKRLLPRRKYMVCESEDMKFDQSVLQNLKSAYYLGYWQTEKYFSDIRHKILEAFTFPPLAEKDKNQVMIESIKRKNSISIHVRRGDYMKIGNTQGICTPDYYVKALKMMLEKTKPDVFLVFSDGIAWCKENLSEYFGDTPVVYVDWNIGSDSFRDIQLMSNCKHNIIANSSFSWWGAWLNQNDSKIVIAPSRWMNNKGWADIIPQSWNTIQV